MKVLGTPSGHPLLFLSLVPHSIFWVRSSRGFQFLSLCKRVFVSLLDHIDDMNQGRAMLTL